MYLAAAVGITSEGKDATKQRRTLEAWCLHKAHMLTISFAPWVVLGRACAEKKLRHYVTAAMRLTAIIRLTSSTTTTTNSTPFQSHHNV
jgi:hypothetical protein